MNSPLASPFDAACVYAGKYGWPVFPVMLIKNPDGGVDKKPLVKWGSEASTDPDTITAWWRRWPTALTAMPTGAKTGVVVLDTDCKHEGANGFHTLADYFQLYDLPETPQVFTRTSGGHAYFAHTGVEIRNSSGETGLGPGLDIRGDGGFIVLPCPGSGYAWHSRLNFDTVKPIPAPAWLGHRQPKPRPHSTRGRRFDPQALLDTACATIRQAGAGQRHDILNREVFSIATLVASGALDEHIACHQLETATAVMVSRTGGDRAKAEQDFEDAFADGLARPRRVRR